jgi:hypothetical protein
MSEKECWKKINGEKPVSEDKKKGYWIDSCPKDCRIVYSEFEAQSFTDPYHVNVFLYGYAKKNGTLKGAVISFYDNKQIAYKRQDKYNIGISFDKNGNFEGFVKNDGVLLDKQEGAKIIAKKRLKNL